MWKRPNTTNSILNHSIFSKNVPFLNRNGENWQDLPLKGFVCVLIIAYCLLNMMRIAVMGVKMKVKNWINWRIDILKTSLLLWELVWKNAFCVFYNPFFALPGISHLKERSVPLNEMLRSFKWNTLYLTGKRT